MVSLNSQGWISSLRQWKVWLSVKIDMVPSSCLLLTLIQLLAFWFVEAVAQTTFDTIMCVKVDDHENCRPPSSEGHFQQR